MEFPVLGNSPERGDPVRVVEGPLRGQTGTVTRIIDRLGLLTVLISLLGRPTPVDLEYWQVERI